MFTIDFHNHFYPPEYLEELETGNSNVKVTYDSNNNPLLHYPGDYNILVPEHRDITYRAEILENSGINMQIVSLTTPGVHIESPTRAVQLARLVNESFAKIMNEYRERFSALATLPLNDPSASVTELEYTFKDLGFRGVMLFSNINGTALSDSQFIPLYERADELQAVFYVHPNYPAGVEAMTDYWLMPLIGFPFDTTLTAAKIVFSGIAKKFPRIRWVFAHLGGAIPYLAERLDRGYYAFKECRENIEKPPSEYLKTFYYDTVNFDTKALQFAIDFAGTEHLLAGSDYPHQIGSLKKMIESINQLQITQKEKAKIYGGNVKKLLNL
jgi:aminocarboxymuconate-semialdehyde decarboxylase